MCGGAGGGTGLHGGGVEAGNSHGGSGGRMGLNGGWVEAVFGGGDGDSTRHTLSMAVCK